MTFLVCGEALYDVFSGAPTAHGVALDARRGGSGFNLAIGLARLGLPVGLFAGVADDALGDGLAAALAREGAQTRFLRRKSAPNTLALVSLGSDGGARYAFHGHGAADRALCCNDLPALDGVRALMFGCLSIVVEPAGATYLTLARRAAAMAERPLITLDPNVRLAAEPEIGLWRARVDAFAALSDIVKVSAEDLEALHPDLGEAAAAARWRGLGASLVVVTDGARGASAHGRFGRVSVDAPAVDVVDTVGAGDSFLAALLAALDRYGRARPVEVAALGRADAAAALACAARAAALTCARRGADPPRRAEIFP